MFVSFWLTDALCLCLYIKQRYSVSHVDRVALCRRWGPVCILSAYLIQVLQGVSCVSRVCLGIIDEP